MSCATKSSLDSICYCNVWWQHAAVMLNSKPHGKRTRGERIDGDSSSGAEVTTRLGHTTLGLRTQTLAPQAASCPMQIPLFLGLFSAQES